MLIQIKEKERTIVTGLTRQFLKMNVTNERQTRAIDVRLPKQVAEPTESLSCQLKY